MNQERVRKEKYGVVDPSAAAAENAGKYGDENCPGAGRGARYHSGSTSPRRSYGTIDARNAGRPFFVGRAVFKSTEAGKLEEAGARQKNPKLPAPERFTFRHVARAREGANA